MAARTKRSSSQRRTKTGTKSRRKASIEVRTEMRHMRTGKHKIKSRKQAVAIGLSKARAKGAKLPRKGAAKKK
jgi:hypothetical protein